MVELQNDTFYAMTELKERLNEYREEERDIENQLERLERLKARMYDVGAQQISDLPKSPSPSSDRIADMVAQKKELEQTIRLAQQDQKTFWNEVERLLIQLRVADEKAVIRMRYHDLEGWYTIAEILFSGREDYEEKIDTYRRRVFRLHGSALQKMAIIIAESEVENQ